jgi:hypothetical protein
VTNRLSYGAADSELSYVVGHIGLISPISISKSYFKFVVIIHVECYSVSPFFPTAQKINLQATANCKDIGTDLSLINSSDCFK